MTAERWHKTEWTDRMAVRLDFSHMMADFIGDNRGITREEIDEMIKEMLYL